MCENVLKDMSGDYCYGAISTQVDDLKGDVAAKDAALRQQVETNSTSERDKKKTETELQSQNTRLNRALEEVVKFRKLLEESKVRTPPS